MVTKVSDKQAKKAAAQAGLARAKVWRDERRKGTDTTTKPTTERKSEDPKPSKRTPGMKAAPNPPGPVGQQCLQYQKTPSKGARAEARAKAKEWSRKKQTVRVAEDTVPAVIETVSSLGEDSLCYSSSVVEEDFKTAAMTQTVAVATMNDSDLKELAYLRNDINNACNRLNDIVRKFSPKKE